MSFLADKKVLVLVADAARGRFFSPHDDTGPLVELETLVDPSARLRGADLKTDRDGRTFDSVGGGRHGMEPGQKSKDHQADSFARDVANRVAELCSDLDRVNLVLIAAPEFLGRLRKCLDSSTRAMVAAEISKDLTASKADEIEAVVLRKLRGEPSMV